MNSGPKNVIERSPVVAVMGHIDHGKSALLDYIQKTNVVAGEAGGITQRLSAYEVIQKNEEGALKSITFLDTPGHEAFQTMRSRGASAADIAILVVSAEEGVKPQTLDALRAISAAKIPYIVAITKIDKENANIERTKQSLAENEMYVEGYGGTISAVPLSSKTGAGITELLNTILLLSSLEGFKGDSDAPAEGVVIESTIDMKKGISATLVIKNGMLRQGSFVVAGTAFAPVRIMENFLGKKISSAHMGQPVRVVGFSDLPSVGSPFVTVESKKEAEERARSNKAALKSEAVTVLPEDKTIVPIIVRGDSVGSLEAVLHEIKKIPQDSVVIKMLSTGVGNITEGDVKMALSDKLSLVAGFSVGVDSRAKDLAERNSVTIATFDVIYKLTEWLGEALLKRTPKVVVEEVKGRAKVLKFFSRSKDRSVIGCRVDEGVLALSDTVKIMRRDVELGRGKITNLQKAKAAVKEVSAGEECGVEIHSKAEPAPGDHLESVVLVEK